MAKWKEVNIYTGLVVDEEAPTNVTGTAVAGTGDDSSVVVVRKKKKKNGLYDGRTKEYRNHRSRLERAREKREALKKGRAEIKREGFTGKTLTRLSQFSRESYLQEDNLQALRDIVKNKSATSLKFKDGKMKVDMFTASAMVKVYDAITKDANKKKIEAMLNGKKDKFMWFAKFAMSQVK
jgi:hypothetical protein